MENKKHKGKLGKYILGLLGLVLLMTGMALLIFQTKTIEVEENRYYEASTIESWIKQDKYSSSSLYIMAKYNLTAAKVPAGAERLQIRLKTPWAVCVKVKEKEMLGKVSLQESLLYFDQEGRVCLNTKKQIEGVPLIDGLVFDRAEVRIGKMLPVEDENIFDNIKELSKCIRKYSLSPDRISCVDTGLALYFGKVEVLVGIRNFEDRLAQLPPILEKLEEQYPGQAGTLHLEQYDMASTSIRFVPKKEE